MWIAVEDENEQSQISFSILGPNTEIKITPEYRDSEFCGEINYLIVLLEVHVFECHVSYRSSLQLKKLHEFEKSVEQLHIKLQGQISFHLENGSLDLEGVIDKLGHIHWTGSMAHDHYYDLVLKFKFTSDQSYLPPLLEQIRHVYQYFPLLADEDGGSS